MVVVEGGVIPTQDHDFSWEEGIMTVSKRAGATTLY